MKGAIIGDVIGSKHEGHSRDLPSKQFQLFNENNVYTDDTVLTCAVAEWLLTDKSLAPLLKRYYFENRGRGYGRGFREWAKNADLSPYNSFGNGSAMRVSPVAWWFDDVEAVMEAAAASAAVTHSHPEGIKGAQAIALATFLARKGESKEAIKLAVEERCGYDLDKDVGHAKEVYDCGASCMQSVPPAIIAFLEGTDFEDVIRTAVFMGGDSDTIAAMAGSIAEGFYGVPEELWRPAARTLSPQLRSVVDRFYAEVAARRVTSGKR